MNRQRSRILTAIAAIGALVAAALLMLPAKATHPWGDHHHDWRRALHHDRCHGQVRRQPGTPTAFWTARIKTKRSSDLHVLQNTIAPGGSFGWHGHPAPAW